MSDLLDKDGEVDEGALLSIIQAEMGDATGWQDDTFTTEIDRNVDAYLGKKYGTEREGFSEHVDRTVFETVESMLPYFMRVFHGNDEAVSYAPVAAADPAKQKQNTEYARQATDYANHVYNVDNNGYRVSRSVIKDALICKVGVWKCWWCEKEREETKRFTGLTDQQVLALKAGAPDAEMEVLSEEDQPDGTKLFDLKIARQWKEGRVEVVAIPPRQLVWARRAADLDDLPFVAHIDFVTRSDLVAEGYDREQVDRIAPTTEVEGGKIRRRTYDTETTDKNAAGRQDKAMEEVMVSECYLRVDLDDDGIAEWNKITVGGDAAGVGGGVILDIEPTDSHPFIIMPAIPTPHQIDGMAVADVTEDLQRLRTEATRQIIDGLFLTNHPRWGYLEGKVDAEALMDNQPGDAIAHKAEGASWRMDQRWDSAQGLPFLQLMDQLVEKRSGVSPLGSVQASASLTKHAEGTVDNLMQASMARQELMARDMAEMGFARLYRRMLKLIVQYQDRKRVIGLRGEFVEMDPAAWSTEMNVEVNPAIGIGRSSARLQILSNVGQVMQQMTQQGYRGIGEEQIYNWFCEFLKAADMPAIEPFTMNVGKMPPPEPPQPYDPSQDPVYRLELDKAALRAKVDLTREWMKDDQKRDEMIQKMVLEAEKLGASEEVERIRAMQAMNDKPAPEAPRHAGQPAQPAPQPQSPALETEGSPRTPAQAETFFGGGQ